MRNIGTRSSNNCCGCSACVDICPVNAITMNTDNNGFLYASVDKDSCIECSKCIKVCQYLTEAEKNIPIEAYASACRNKDSLKKSASGGCFYSIAEEILCAGGAAIGCAYSHSNNTLSVQHILTRSSSELYQLQGSKYVQSDTVGIFNLVEEEAKKGIPIVFSGTPCQVAACKLFLGKKYENVFFADIICHGVPSQSLFKSFVTFLEKKRGAKIVSIVFRDKDNGWGLNGSIIFKKGNNQYKKKIKSGGSSYYSLFLNAQTYRDSCYECKYASNKRVGDITLGDYWGIEKIHPEYLNTNGGILNKIAGISCILINTEKGKELIDKYGKNLILLPSSYEHIAEYNTQLRRPSRKGANRDTILEIYSTQGYDQLEKWFNQSIGPKNILYKLYEWLSPRKRIAN